MSGTLYLCATPIGNLEDMTFRCVRILKEVDLIAAEDTRNSIKLLNHFDIHTPMTSYHEYNKIAKAHTLIEHLENGEDIALITDAGTPGISDPGEDLVAMCQEAGITVTVVPGAAACITALTISGLSTRRFAFEAFLPTDKKERQAVLNELTEETRTMIIYEAPHRLVLTLELLLATLGDRRIRICRELTKKHETVFATTISAAVEYYKEQVKQKNRLGYMISIGCVLFLILQSLFYIGVNAGLYPISGNYMPFLSHGNMTMMITYFYMGILLSVYRNTNVVKN